MQVIYAAPFVLLSLIAFACCLVIPRSRPYAFRALVAPVAFGFCSISAMAVILVASDRLHLRFANSPSIGVGLLVGIAIYLTPGVIGAWMTVEVVRQIEIRLMKTERERAFATRIVIALIIFGPTFIACTGAQFKWFPRAEEWWPLCFVFSFVAAGLAAAVTYLLTRSLQERAHAE